MSLLQPALRLALSLGIFQIAHAADPQPPADKSHFSLFSPTPRDQMREMSTDRPDKTESPHTVDAGHFQIEADLVTYGLDRHNPERARRKTEAYSFASTNFKAGLSQNVDFQLVVETYRNERTADRDARLTERHRGFGDLTARLKVNLWGNDGGTTAFALMPFLKIPTSQDGLGNHALEGGLILPLAVALPGGWGMGVMTQPEVRENSDSSGYHLEWINTITLGRDIIGKLGGYVEFFSAVSAESDTPWVGTFDVGLTYALSGNLQLDAGINIGLTRAADDFNPFLGVSWRF